MGIRLRFGFVVATLLLYGCATPDYEIPMRSDRRIVESAVRSRQSELAALDSVGQEPLRRRADPRYPLASAAARSELAPSPLGIPPGVRPITRGEWHPVDLPVVLQLVGEKSVAVEIARRAVEEAVAQEGVASAQFLGKLFVGTSFAQHSGGIQDVVGNVFDTNKSNYRLYLRPSLQLNPARAVFETLQAKQIGEASRFGLQRVQNDTVLAAVEGFYDLGRAAEQHRVASAALERASELVRVTEKGQAGGVRTPADTARAKALAARKELLVQDAAAGFQRASVRLAELLRLPPDVTLYPANMAAVHARVELVAPDAEVRTLVAGALSSHPRIAEQERLVRAANEERRAAKWEGLFPRIGIDFAGGGLGGGVGTQIGGPRATEDVAVTIGWELDGFGFGNFARERAARARLRRNEAILDGARDRVAADVVDAYIEVRLRLEQIDTARRQLEAASASFTEISKRAAAGLGIQLDVLTALEDLADAETNVVNATVDYNKAQYRLFNRLGRRPGQE